MIISIGTSITASIAIAALAGLPGCDGYDGAIGDAARPIIGGAVTLGDPAVVMLFLPDGQCTGTLISREIVLTAAHCVHGAIERGQTASGSASFGTGTASDPFFATRRVLDMIVHRRYSVGLFAGFDIALVRIEPAPAEVEPLPVQTAPLTDTVAPGDLVRVVGFGVNNGGAQTGAGIKRTAELSIAAITAEHVVMGDADVNTCQGDSGGPTLAGGPGAERVIAVTSFGVVGCGDPSSQTRVDVFADFIAEVVAAWDGPCRTDGACVAGCGEPFADPDCDPCGLDGTCAAGCPRVDLDCPLGGLAGEACAGPDDCESRVCAPADADSADPDEDDPQATPFCSATCEQASDCEAPLTVCEDGLCRRFEPTAAPDGGCAIAAGASRGAPGRDRGLALLALVLIAMFIRPRRA